MATRSNKMMDIPARDAALLQSHLDADRVDFNLVRQYMKERFTQPTTSHTSRQGQVLHCLRESHVCSHLLHPSLLTLANRCILSSLAAHWTTRHRPPLSAYACQHSWPIQEDFSITTQLQWHVLEPPTKRLRTTTQKIIGDPQFAHEAGFSQDPFICQFQRLAFQKLFPENQIQPLSPKNTRYHALSSWWHRIVISKHTEFSTVWSPGDIGSFGPLQRVWTDDGWDMYLRVSPYPTALKDLNLIF